MYLSQIAKCICPKLQRHSIPPQLLVCAALQYQRPKENTLRQWCGVTVFAPKTFLALLVQIGNTAEKALLTHLEFKLCQFVGFSAKF